MSENGVGKVSVFELAHQLFGVPLEQHRRFLEDLGLGGQTDLIEKVLKTRGSLDKILAEEKQEGWDRLIGRIVDGYEILEKLGEGGMGAVFLAAPPRPDADPVALKVVPQEWAGRLLKSRFIREVEALKKINHPNVVGYVGEGVIPDGLPFEGANYLVESRIKGLPIHEFCRNIGLDIGKRLKIFLQLCRGTQECHEEGIVHRDIKPNNVFVEEGTGVVKIFDFGISMLADAGGGGLATVVTTEGDRPASISHASPEQLTLASDEIDQRTDVYSLGIVLFGLLTDRHPLPIQGLEFTAARGVAINPQALRIDQAITSTDSRHFPYGGRAYAEEEDPTRPAGKLDSQLQAVVETALAPNRSDRYSTASQLGDEIERVIEGFPVHARAATKVFRVRKWAGRNWAWFVPVCLLALALVLFSGYLSYQNRQLIRANQETDQLAVAFSDLLGAAEPGYAVMRLVRVDYLLKTGKEKVEKFSENPRLQMALMFRLGQINSTYGIYDEAETLLQGSLELRQGLPDKTSPSPSEILLEIAKARIKDGKNEDAVGIVNEVLEGLRGAPSAFSDLESTALIIRGDAKLNLGDADDARIDYEEARRLSIASGSSDLAYALQGLAKIEGGAGNGLQALELLEQATDVAKREFGNDSDEVGSLLNDRAWMYLQLEEYDQAEMHFDQSLEIRRRLFGEDHPRVATTLANMAVLAYYQKQYEEMESLNDRALEIYDAIGAGQHPRSIKIRVSRAARMFQQGQAAEALALLDTFIEKLNDGPGSRSTEAALAWSTYGVILRETGQPLESLPYLERSVEIRKEIHGEDSIFYAKGLNGLAESLIACQKYDEATSPAQIVLSIRRAKLPATHSSIGHSFQNLTTALIGANNHDKGAEIVTQWTDYLTSTAGVNDGDLPLVLCLQTLLSRDQADRRMPRLCNPVSNEVKKKFPALF